MMRSNSLASTLYTDYPNRVYLVLGKETTKQSQMKVTNIEGEISDEENIHIDGLGNRWTP